jgi:ubiquinone/menaquinone biosynthesis C-methylase UbiE
MLTREEYERSRHAWNDPDLVNKYTDTHNPVDGMTRYRLDFLDACPTASAPGGRKRILDAGCGPGRDVKAFAAHQTVRVTGVDFSPEMLAKARELFPDGHFRVMDLTGLAFPPASFDGVWCCASLHFLIPEDAHKALLEFARVLVPDGVLFLSLEKLFDKRQPEQIDALNRWRKFYTEQELHGMLDRVGFQYLKHYQGDTNKGTVDNRRRKWLYFFAKKASTL